jgi:branched-chain amino acid aminotransferase
VISPVGELRYGDRVLAVGDGKVGPLSQRLYDELVAIQFGKAPDPMGWVEPV